MATNDDLDDFFKKKDRKGNKHKKQTGLLTNNEELLKQLVIVTSATSAFKENMDLDEDDDQPQPINDDSGVGTIYTDDHSHKQSSHHHHKNKTSSDDTTKHPNGQQQQQANPNDNTSNQQDEWEEFIDPNSKYEQLRLKFAGAMNNDDNDDEYYDDDNNPNLNDDNNERNINREQNKDKPVWRTDQIKQQQAETNVTDVNEESTAASASTAQAKPATTGAYRPPQLRTAGSGGVTVVSGVSQRPAKKEKPNIASTDEFPTLGAAVNKK